MPWELYFQDSEEIFSFQFFQYFFFNKLTKLSISSFVGIPWLAIIPVMARRSSISGLSAHSGVHHFMRSSIFCCVGIPWLAIIPVIDFISLLYFSCHIHLIDVKLGSELISIIFPEYILVNHFVFFFSFFCRFIRKIIEKIFLRISDVFSGVFLSKIRFNFFSNHSVKLTEIHLFFRCL